MALLQVFGAFEKSHDTLTAQHNVSFEFWLNVEAFEYLRDDPCLPLDPASSGMGELLNRASKARSAPSYPHVSSPLPTHRLTATVDWQRQAVANVTRPDCPHDGLRCRSASLLT